MLENVTAANVTAAPSIVSLTDEYDASIVVQSEVGSLMWNEDDAETVYT